MGFRQERMKELISAYAEHLVDTIENSTDILSDMDACYEDVNEILSSAGAMITVLSANFEGFKRIVILSRNPESNWGSVEALFKLAHEQLVTLTENMETALAEAKLSMEEEEEEEQDDVCAECPDKDTCPFAEGN